MAIINCPYCNNMVSDNAEKCVHCGSVLRIKKTKYCLECGEIVDIDDQVCRRCGNPLNPPKRKSLFNKHGNEKSKKTKIVVSVVIIVLIITCILLVFSIARDEKYKFDLYEVSNNMISGSVDAEACCNKIIKIWENSIFKKSDTETDKYTKINGVFNDDFNASLKNYFEDLEYSSIVFRIKTNIELVRTGMNDLLNPSKKNKMALDDLKVFYDSYIALTDMCINPTGSFQSYSSKFSDVDSEVVKNYKKIQIYYGY